jgi:hypothetical protein
MTHRALQSKCSAYGFACDLILADNAEASMLAQVFILHEYTSYMDISYNSHIMHEIYVHAHTHTHMREAA